MLLSVFDQSFDLGAYLIVDDGRDHR